MRERNLSDWLDVFAGQQAKDCRSRDFNIVSKNQAGELFLAAPRSPPGTE